MGCAGSSRSKCCHDQPLTPEQEVQLNKLKEEAYGKYKNIALVLLGASLIGISCGIVLIVLGHAGGFPITSSGPIWSGCIVLGAAILGLVGISTDKDEKTTDGRSKRDYYISTSVGILTWMFIWVGMCIGYAIYTIVVCAQKDEKKCPDYPDVLLAMQIVSIVMYAVFVICNIMTCRIFKCYEQQRKQMCPSPTSGQNLNVQTSYNQYGMMSQNQYGMQPPTYDQSMSTSKY